MLLYQEQHKFPTEVKKQLQYYVYLYSDPDTGRAIYVGKGKDDRCFSHLEAVGDSPKAKAIRMLLDAGKKPVIEILAWGLTEREALAAERVAIDLLGIDSLTNRQKGHGAKQGRILAERLANALSSEKLTEEDVEEMKRLNVMAIRLGKYSEAMSEMELYDLTRSAWKIGREKREKIRYVFAVSKGRILEVYQVLGWFREGETMMRLENVEKDSPNPDRFEFVGNIAPEWSMRFKGKDMSGCFKRGFAGPFQCFMPE